MVKNARLRHTLTLYTTVDGVQRHRAPLVPAAKRVLVDPDKLPEDLIDLNQYAGTPTLVDHHLILFDCPVVGESIDERYSHLRLTPIGPPSRAALRRLGGCAYREGLVATARRDCHRWSVGRCSAQTSARTVIVHGAIVQGIRILPQPGNERARLPGRSGDLAFALAGGRPGARRQIDRRLRRAFVPQSGFCAQHDRTGKGNSTHP